MKSKSDKKTKYAFLVLGLMFLAFGLFLFEVCQSDESKGSFTVKKSIDQEGIEQQYLDDEDVSGGKRVSLAKSESQASIVTQPFEGEKFISSTGVVESVKPGMTPGSIYRYDLSKKTFSAIALRWQGGPSVNYAFSDSNEVQHLQPVPLNDEKSGYESYITSELLFSSNDDRYLYLQKENGVTNLQIDMISPGTKVEGALSGSYNQNSGAKYTTLPIISRDEWGAGLTPPDIDDPARLTWEPAYYHVNRIIIHHTVTPNTPADPAYYVRTVYLYHAVTNGWGDVGYNFMIDHLGNIYEGKLGGDEVKGYHAGATANRGSIGIALLGDFTSVSPTQAAKDSLIKLMAEKAAFYNFNLNYSPRNLTNWLNTGYTVFGHRDSYNRVDEGGWIWKPEYTACPGNTFYPELGTITALAQAYKETHFEAIKTMVTNVEKAFESASDGDYIMVELNDGYTRDEVIPSFSGITFCNEYKDPSKLIVLIPDWDKGGAYPPEGWTGWEDIQTYFPSSHGYADRARTLLKIFSFDSRIKSVRATGSYGELH